MSQATCEPDRATGLDRPGVVQELKQQEYTIDINIASVRSTPSPDDSSDESAAESSVLATPELLPARELAHDVVDKRAHAPALGLRLTASVADSCVATPFTTSPSSPAPATAIPLRSSLGPSRSSRRSRTTPAQQQGTLLSHFVAGFKELEAYRSGSKPVLITGRALTLPAVVAVARYASASDSYSSSASALARSGVSIVLDESDEAHERVAASRALLDRKLSQNKSIYGVSTGFGGSADTRTENHNALGLALLQHQASGVLSLPGVTSPDVVSRPLPLSDPLACTSMPEAWVRGAMLIRANSLIRGHSAVRWELVERMVELLKHDIVPVVPQRGSISASGDLSPLSYVAGTITGNPSIYAYCGSRKAYQRTVRRSTEALAAAALEPLHLKPKEHLGILNGTAFSTAVGTLALQEATQLAILTEVCTALGVEAMRGCAGSFAKFVSDVARPHPGQIEVAATVRGLLTGSKLALSVEEEAELEERSGLDASEEEELTIEEDKGKLRQDRYPLRTAPQFIGPQFEDILSALKTLGVECNSTTDNPLIDPATSTVHHGGNFQAMAVSSALEKTRLSLHHFGKILFAQCTELNNPAQNRGLPPNLAATDPSLNFCGKGIDIACAAYVSELGYLANPVGTHIQSAEMHNQAVNSLALISARATIQALEVLTMLIASYLYALCQALDLRALQDELASGVDSIVREELATHFGSDAEKLFSHVSAAAHDSIEGSSTMDAGPRMHKAARATTAPIVEHLLGENIAAIAALPAFRSALATRAAELLHMLRTRYLTGDAGRAPAAKMLGRTRAVYEFVRLELGIRMHGKENLEGFVDGIGHEERTIGGDVSMIYEAIRDGKMQGVLVKLFDEESSTA